MKDYETVVGDKTFGSYSTFKTELLYLYNYTPMQLAKLWKTVEFLQLNENRLPVMARDM